MPLAATDEKPSYAAPRHLVNILRRLSTRSMLGLHDTPTNSHLHELC
jgi:hypothetical protein